MKDDFKKGRKTLRPNYSYEFKGKADKKVNRRIVRKRLKDDLKRDTDKEE